MSSFDKLHIKSKTVLDPPSASAIPYRFDPRANLRQEMEERKQRFEDKKEVRGHMAEVLKKLVSNVAFFDNTHIFTPHHDVPDDSSLRLIVLAPEQFYLRAESRLAFDGVLDHVRNHGAKSRYHSNRLIFLAPDHGALTQLRDCIRIALAWNSIVEDVRTMRLVLDNLQTQQAKEELQATEDVLQRVAQECYKWLLCPVQNNPAVAKLTVDVFPLNTSGATLESEIEQVCVNNELVITAWSPIHLREELKKRYWKDNKPAFGAKAFWDDMLRYIYLPRLKNRSVLEQAIVKGASSRDFFGTAYVYHDRKFDGFKFCDANVQLDDTLLLIEPDIAKAYEAAHSLVTPSAEPTPSGSSPSGSTPRTFHGSVAINASTAKIGMVQVAEEIIAVLAADPNAEINVAVEIQVNFPSGASDQTKRTITENARTLNFKNADWE